MITKVYSEKYQKEQTKEFDSFTALSLGSKLLSIYISNPEVKDIFNKNIHLYRTPEKREVEYPYKNQVKPWFEFQIDRGSASMFCPIPSLRRERLKKQIVIFKTFWDIAAYQRTSPLKDIISEVEAMSKSPDVN